MHRFVPVALCLFILGAAACSKMDAGSNAAATSPRDAAENGSVTVPFVGCASDGQTGPQPAPTGRPRLVNIDPAIAPRLAWYASQGFGVLAPRGWSCFERYGSSGASLLVAPGPLTFDTADPSKTASGVVVTSDSGGTSGRFIVAKVIARVFPDRAAFAKSVIAEGVEPEGDFTFGPYPGDQITSLGADALSFRTPALTEGLGTLAAGFAPADQPIDGLAFLSGTDTDLTVLAVRLPGDLAELRPAIIQAFESANLPKGATTALAAAKGFYGALAQGDGATASTFVVAAKRASGPFSSDALTKFYGGLATPLSLTSATPQPDGTVAVRYAYAVAGGRRCNGAAVVSTEAAGGVYLISGIRALNGC